MPTVGSTVMLDRLGPKRSDAEFLKSKLEAPGARFLVLADLKPVIRSNAQRTEAKLAWFSREDLTEFGLPLAEALFLGVDRASNGHFALAVTEHRTRHVPGAIEKLRPIVDLRSLAMQGHHVAGGAVAVRPGARARPVARERPLLRPLRRHHPGEGRWLAAQVLGLRPGMVPAHRSGGDHADHGRQRCLLAHEHRYGDKMFSALAGFIEPGEDIEHAVRREVFEETGVKVGEVEFHSSQPWPFPHSLMLGCVGQAETTELVIDTNEIAEARWFTRPDARLMLERRHPDGLTVPGKQAIANALITSFVDAA